MDDIDWDQNPKSTFKKADGSEVSFLEYYRKVGLSLGWCAGSTQALLSLAYTTEKFPTYQMHAALVALSSRMVAFNSASWEQTGTAIGGKQFALIPSSVASLVLLDLDQCCCSWVQLSERSQ